MNGEQLITKHKQPTKKNKNSLHLERYIRFLKERRPDRRIVYHGIRFHLNEEVLSQIEQARSQGLSLFIKPKFLADLRYYLLFDEYSGLSCGINVSTYYLEENTEQTVMRSLISIDGDILYQVDRRYLEQPDLAIALTSAHYWLIEQLLGKLRLEGKLLLFWVSWILSLGFSLYAFWPSFLEFWQQDLLGILKMIGIFLLFSLPLQQILRYLVGFIMGRIWSFLLRQMLAGGLSKRYRFKQIILWILRRLRL
ncbi:MAG: hypothetical protein AB4290_13475 [Spirulina sp.]